MVCDPGGGEIIGYVSLCAAQIARAHLPRAAHCNRADPLPAMLLARLAVDRRRQGERHSRALILFALLTAVRMSRDIGCFGVITHPIDDGVRSLYARYGFEDLPFDPDRSMAVRIVDLIKAGIGPA